MEHGGNCGNVQKRATKSDTSGPGHCLVCAACPTASCATRRRSLHRVLRLRCAGSWPALDRAVAQPGPNASDDSDAPGSRPLAQARARGLARPGPGDSVDSIRSAGHIPIQNVSGQSTLHSAHTHAVPSWAHRARRQQGAVPLVTEEQLLLGSASRRPTAIRRGARART